MEAKIVSSWQFAVSHTANCRLPTVMDLFHMSISMLSKSIAMTNKEILQADVLDILFENRNKAYGAYALRKNYNHRLQWALGISLALVFLLLIFNLKNEKKEKIAVNSVPDIVVRTVALPKPQTPEPPRPLKHPDVAQIKDVIIKIVPDNEVKKTEVPTVKELETAMISTITKGGISPDSLKGNSNDVKGNGNNDDKITNDTEFYSKSSDAQYPGGKDAFTEFLRKYLNIPEDLEANEKKMVLVRFMVDVDGAISKTEIVQSGAEKYDREVIRVLRKMPKWVPAMQNGIKVATYFTQPVTFIGIEE
jgi:protein TonB